MACAEIQQNSVFPVSPYKHQVHGHHVILKWTPQTVLKNTNLQEETFYETIKEHSEVLLPWVPKFVGVVHVASQSGDDEIITLKIDHGVDSKHILHEECRVRLTNNNLELVDSTGEQISFYSNGELSPAQPIHISHVHTLNPWTVHCLTRKLPLLLSAPLETHRFLVFEDITWNFALPNILDVKMGTTPQKFDISEEKVARKTRKWEQTTSHEVGLRVDGMQVYSPSEHHYNCYNKYYGYQLDVQGLRFLVQVFLQEFPLAVQVMLAQEIRTKISELRDLVATLDSYRFFSSSLLIICEGQPESTAARCCQKSTLKCPRIDVRFLDFEHTTFKGFQSSDPVDYSGPDIGFLTGADFLLDVLDNFLRDKSKHSSSEQCSESISEAKK